jgi:peptidoglycan/xylan/chitin deacetylase (PgdA/CDA1 family)
MTTASEILYTTAAATALVGAALRGTFLPRSSFWGPVISKSRDVTKPWVSLTFDDGPTPGSTDRVLDILAEVQAPATFFVIGRSAKKSPALVRRIFEEGHLVANHTFDHDHFGMFRGPRYWHQQLSRTDEIISELIGRRPALFRPSMGFTTWPIHRAARRAGQATITWSLRACDGIRGEQNEILQRLLPPAGPGDILMLHDGIDPQLRRPTDRAPTLAALRPLIEGLRQRQLTPVRLDQLLGIPAYADCPAEPAAGIPLPSTARTIV